MNTRLEQLLRAGAVLSALTLIVAPVKAQILYGSIVGTIRDSTNAAIAGAAVQIANIATGETRQTATNAQGDYSFPSVPAGRYNITISKPGFQKYTAQALSVAVDQTVRFDATLQIGSINQTVEVSAEALTLQTESAQVQGEITTRSLENVPVPINRNFENLLITIPGMGVPQNANSTAANPARGEEFSVNGTPLVENNVRIDGASVNNIWLPYLTAYVPALEAIDQVSVVTNAFDASQGVVGGAAINVHIKSGTNELHGSAFEYNINNDLTALPFFNPPGQTNPKNINNDFGGTIGGPIIKNKLFYFGSVDENRIRQFASTLTTVPTAAIRSGDMSGSSNPIYDPSTGNTNGTGRTVFPNNRVPASLISPITEKLIALTPLPNQPGTSNNYYASGDFAVDRRIIDAKVDYRPTDKLSLAARFGWLDYNMISPPVFGNSGLGPPVSSTGGRAGTGFGDVYSSTFSGTYIASPNLVIDSYFSVTQVGTNSEPPGLDQNLGLTLLGIPGTNGPSRAYGGLPEFEVTGFTTLGNAGSAGGPIYYDDRQYGYSASASWIKGTHTLHFGYEVNRQSLNHFETTSAPGDFAFSGGVTTRNGGPSSNQYNAYAEFLLGLPSSAVHDLLPFDGNRLVLHMWLHDFYFQDQWKVAPKLTLSYGLGYSLFPIGTRNTRGLERYNFNTNQVELCGVALNPVNCGYDVSKTEFSPNLGIAYRVTNTFVIRVGGSITYDPEPLAFNRDMLANYPEDLQINLAGINTYQPATTLAAGIPAILVPNIRSGLVTLPPGFNIQTLPQHVRRDYVESWNLTLQKEFGDGFSAQAGYVSTRGVDIPQELNLNVGQVGGGVPSERYYQLFGTQAALNLLTPVNHTHYDSLQSSLGRRFAKRYSVDVGYTFSKNTGICCNFLADTAPAISIPQYMNLARALEPFDRTHVLTISSVAELPFGKGRRWLSGGGFLSAVTGGWQLSGLFSDYSGLPFSVSASGTSLNAPRGNTQRANQVKQSVQILGGIGPNESYFDPFAFAPVTTAAFGTAGYNTLRGPGTRNLDLSLFRNFRFTERWNLQFRAEAFNLTNTPHFSTPNGNVSNLVLNPNGTIKSLGGYTTITSTLGTGREGIDQREIRLGLRLSF